METGGDERAGSCWRVAGMRACVIGMDVCPRCVAVCGLGGHEPVHGLACVRSECGE